MSGWIVPVRKTYYPLQSNTFYFTTESVTGGGDQVYLHLYADSGAGVGVTYIIWRFKDWAYVIRSCTPAHYSLKFPVTPPTDVNKTWEVTFTTEDVKIKCNSLQVLHFIFNNTHNGACTSNVKGKKATRVLFNLIDTATKMFTSELVGKLK